MARLETSRECVRAQLAVSMRLDGELSDFACAWLSAHLRTCPTCSLHALELGAIARELREAQHVAPCTWSWGEFPIWSDAAHRLFVVGDITSRRPQEER